MLSKTGRSTRLLRCARSTAPVARWRAARRRHAGSRRGKRAGLRQGCVLGPRKSDSQHYLHGECRARYKVQLRVIDHTGSASFLLFDLEANQILNKTAINLRDKLMKESNENLELDESIKEGEQITDVDTDTFSITCSSSSITPLKRSISDNDRGEDLSVDNVPAQHSCSKMKKLKLKKKMFEVEMKSVYMTQGKLL
ncbi:hypothetical protein Taro_017748 [Colocasia esculenta]|uniref:Replication factor A C-terminal domain-containing protein n=1 Tax=Colocasia esculenta TaxID=4460 RepID=A0A843V0A6_COLES|nr:hypothetical protein [Colocasia esculenta]